MALGLVISLWQKDSAFRISGSGKFQKFAVCRVLVFWFSLQEFGVLQGCCVYEAVVAALWIRGSLALLTISS